MKKLILLIVLFPVLAWAGPGYLTYDSNAVPVAGCNPASNEVGFRDGTWTTGTMGTGKARANLCTPDCSGPLNTAYVRHYTANSENVKVAIYLDDGDSAPDSGDTLVAYSGAISGSVTATWYSAAMTTTPNVSTGSSYWVVLISEDAADFGYYYHATGITQYVATVSGWYASPPDNLDATWGTNTQRQDAAYVSIGE